MYTTGLALTSLLGLTATAAPQNLATSSTRRDATFGLHVYNNCPFVKEVGLYTVTSEFKMDYKSDAVNIWPGQSHTFYPSFYDIGMRLAGHMEWNIGDQWTKSQALFEFGYAVAGGVEGTAYDLSFMMPVADPDIGMGVWPIDNGRGSGQCASKICFPWDCPVSQGWTNSDQWKIGSLADTGCYTHGPTDLKVVYCP